MDREHFVKYSYRHSEIIVFHQKHPEMDVDCLLLGVDFDLEQFRLGPLDTDTYRDESFWVGYERCDKPHRCKMKVVENKE